MKLQNILKKYRDDHGLSQRQLANQCGLSNGYISILEKGKNPNTGKPVTPTLPQLKKLASGMSMTIHELLTLADDMPISLELDSISKQPIPTASNISPLPPMKQWPVLGGTACGEPIYKALEEESVLAPADIDADFVLRCVGDSMINARIFDGDAVFVKCGPVDDGQIALVRIDDEYTLKRIYHGLDYLELRSENPMYKPIIIRGEQENAEIVGRAVHFLSRVI